MWSWYGPVCPTRRLHTRPRSRTEPQRNGRRTPDRENSEGGLPAPALFRSACSPRRWFPAQENACSIRPESVSRPANTISLARSQSRERWPVRKLDAIDSPPPCRLRLFKWGRHLAQTELPKRNDILERDETAAHLDQSTLLQMRQRTGHDLPDRSQARGNL